MIKISISAKKFFFTLLPYLTVLLLIILAEQFTDLDYWVQDWIFQSGSWPINETMHDKLSPVFYSGIKVAIGIFAGICLILFITSFIKSNLKLKLYRSGLAIVFLSVIFVPLVVAGSKDWTHVYCPVDTIRYGGNMPNIKLLESYPEDFNPKDKGGCFPAGHATGGFALMSLFFLFTDKRNKFLGLFAGIFLGWVMGGYQMLRGEHFLSHTLTTMVAAWIIILLAGFAVNECASRRHADNMQLPHQ